MHEYQKRIPSEPMHSEKSDSERRTADDDGCRCRESVGKTFPEMLKMMLRDLAFWKRGK